MCVAKLLRGGAVVVAVVLGLQLDAAADPVTYEGTLTNAVSGTGSVPLNSTVRDATRADYWRFWATAGDSVTVITERVDFGMDPAHHVYSDVYVLTTDVGLTNGTDDLADGTNLIDFGDDEIDHPGPFGDARSVFTAATTGWYTVAVTNFLGNGNGGADEDYDYSVTVRGITGSPEPEPTPVPEPTFLALLACGACGVALSRRRKAVS
jgi:hypothetical protein